jgi:hypothetical protein
VRTWVAGQLQPGAQNARRALFGRDTDGGQRVPLGPQVGLKLGRCRDRAFHPRPAGRRQRTVGQRRQVAL